MEKMTYCSGLIIVFTGCKKDKDAPGNSSITTIIAKVENGSNLNLDNVKAVVDDDYVVIENKYASG